MPKLGEFFQVQFEYQEDSRGLLSEVEIEIEGVGVLFIDVMSNFIDEDFPYSYFMFNGKPLVIQLPAQASFNDQVFRLPATMYVRLEVSNVKYRTEDFINRLIFTMKHREYGGFTIEEAEDLEQLKDYFKVDIFNESLDIDGKRRVLFFNSEDPQDLRDIQFMLSLQEE